MSREQQHGTTRIADTAVVVGASMAGLCAARVLADRFERVEVVDRDVLPDSPTWRKQVPQGRHPHLLLVAGARLFERWFPGILEELDASGAIEVDLVADLYWHQGGGVARRLPSSLRGPAMSRPLLEWTVRQRAAAHPNVTIRGGIRADGLVLGTGGHQVTGLRLDDGTTIHCSLVVDASGRQARSLDWLEDAGYTRPRETRVTIDTRYVTQERVRTSLPSRDWKMAGVIDRPETKRLAMALPIEGDRWLVMFGGLHGEVAPLDESERLDYARSLPSPVIGQVLESSEAIGATVTHHFTASQRRHLRKLKRFPIGWVLLGDAVASFNPIYGQGMTSAALQAEALGDALDRAGAVDRRFARRYFKEAERIVDVAWSTAVGSDFVHLETTGPKPPGTDLVNRYIDRVVVAAQHDDAVSLRFGEVVAMVRRPESLMSPGIMWRVVRAGGRPAANAPATEVEPPLHSATN